ncbi:hypothetical protein Q6288_06400 [Klebsiella quasipneumoniae]|uniref:hypothetical protein n=1 Tax=Klebsiella pneumoniae complex TaxID=3390273 RepID=UPI002731DCB4|nr:hypothetical protein [Klebsiella quasipneumoniae]MDP1093787.1 hypothetical protein [Klebsiella quasipneumoniae]
MKTIILVLLYNKECYESNTLKALSQNAYSDYDLYVYNNGPNTIEFNNELLNSIVDKINGMYFSESLNNMPLSHIYNDFFEKFPNHDRYIIFDDDTNVGDCFFSVLDSEENIREIDLQLPLIKSSTSNDIYYPEVNGKICGKYCAIKNHDTVRSIGSGLIIYKKMILSFYKNNMQLFDEHFALYGVDTSLFQRISVLRKNGINFNIVIAGELIHSLSRVDESASDWRRIERLYDRILSILYYSPSKKLMLWRLSKVFIKSALSFNLSNCLLILKTIKKGSHPRC